MEDTTNSDDGATTSAVENLKEFEYLKTLINAIPENEDVTAWLECTRLLARASQLPPSYDPPLVKAIVERLHLHPAEGASYKEAIKQLRTPRLIAKRKANKKNSEASRFDYYALFTDVLGALPRDLFSGKCMYRDASSIWQSAWNMLPQVKSDARQINLSPGPEFNVSAIEDHFFAFEQSQPFKLIPEIPEWDGRDRIREMAVCLELDKTQKFDNDVLYELLCDWCAGIFKKIEHPGYRNPILILKGPQNIGKDWWINTLTNGFEQWAEDLNLSGGEKDSYLQLSSAAILKIAEFDRTAKTDTATIKDMITRASTNIRAPYAHDAVRRVCRASFVASVNTDDIYRDSTGHTRYLVFNLKGINFAYSRTISDQKQILAQAQHLAANNYKASKESKQKMGEFLEEKTPESIEDMIAECWEAETELIKDDKINRRIVPWITNREADQMGIFDRICKKTGLHLKTVRGALKRHNYGVKDYLDDKKQHRGYVLKLNPGQENNSERHIEELDENEIF